jgi:hypothetical protein
LIAAESANDDRAARILLKEVAMCKRSVALAALIAVHLILPISAASAQAEMATGDVWSSREDRVYVPQEALELPDPIAPDDIEIATGDVWPLRNKQIQVPQEALVPNNVDDQASVGTSR